MPWRASPEPQQTTRVACLGALLWWGCFCSHWLPRASGCRWNRWGGCTLLPAGLPAPPRSILQSRDHRVKGSASPPPCVTFTELRWIPQDCHGFCFWFCIAQPWLLPVIVPALCHLQIWSEICIYFKKSDGDGQVQHLEEPLQRQLLWLLLLIWISVHLKNAELTFGAACFPCWIGLCTSLTSMQLSASVRLWVRRKGITCEQQDLLTVKLDWSIWTTQVFFNPMSVKFHVNFPALSQDWSYFSVLLIHGSSYSSLFVSWPDAAIWLKICYLLYTPFGCPSTSKCIQIQLHWPRKIFREKLRMTYHIF